MADKKQKKAGVMETVKETARSLLHSFGTSTIRGAAEAQGHKEVSTEGVSNKVKLKERHGSNGNSQSSSKDSNGRTGGRRIREDDSWFQYTEEGRKRRGAK